METSEHNTHERSSAEEQAEICKVGLISVGPCVNRETMDEVNALELSGSLSADGTTLSQPILVNNSGSSVLEESEVFTTPERNLMVMEQLSQNGEKRVADSVNHHSDEAISSHAVVFTTPEQVLLMGDPVLDEVGKKEENTATESPDESDVLNGDEIKRNEEIRTDELHCESGTITRPNRRPLLASFVSENSGGNNAMERHETAGADFMPKGSQADNAAGLNATQGTSKQSKVNSPHVDTIMECNPEPELFVETDPSPSLVQLAVSLPTGPILVKEAVLTLIAEENTKNNEKYVQEEEDSFVAKLAEAEAVLENSEVFTTPERKLMMMEQVSQNGKTLAGDSVTHQSDEAVESHGVVFTTPEQVLLLGDYWIDEVGKKVYCDNITGGYIASKSHDISDGGTASESQFIMGDSEPEEAENKDVEQLGQGHSLSVDTGLEETRKATTCEESFVFISPERLLHLEKYEPHTAGNQEGKEVEFKDESALFTWFETCLHLGESARDILGNNKSGSSPHDSSAKVILKKDSVARGSHVPALDLGDNTVTDSSGSITSKVSYSHGEETVGSKAENVDSDGAETIMDAERNASISSHVLFGTCSLVPEESSPSTNIHDQINDALEELAITDSDEADDLIETKVTTQRDDKGSLMLDSSGGSSVSGNEEDEH